MFKYLNKRRQKGQSTLEYAILIIIIIGALLSIQVYIKRGIQGRLKSATDDIGDQFKVGGTNVVTTMSTRTKSDDTFKAGETSSILVGIESTNTTFSSNIIAVDQEYWGG